MNAPTGKRRDRAEEILEQWLLSQMDDGAPDKETFLESNEDLRDLLEEMLGEMEFAQGVLDDQARKRAMAEATSETPSDPAAGGVLGDFQILKELGRGGMGVVYAARQTSLQRTVALKVLPQHLTLNARTVERFKREAATAARLRHPGIVPVFAIGEEDGAHFFAMELVDGVSLDRVLNELRGRKPAELTGADLAEALEASELNPSQWVSEDNRAYVKTAVEIICQVGDALEFAHQAEVLHRDVKPGNILLRSDGKAVLTDFGLSREQTDPSLSLLGEFHGTPYYASPEQALSGRANVDRRSDVYSLGVTLYELLTLQRPFAGETPQEVFSGIVSKTPANPRTYHPRLSEDLVTIVMKAMDRDLDRRYQTIAEFVEDLQAFLEYRPVKARPLPMWVHAQRWGRREPLRVALLALGVITLVTTSVLWRRAEGLLVRAEMAEADAVAERDRALGAEADVLLRNYQNQLALVFVTMAGGTYDQAREYLEECPPEFRGWIWGHLDVALNSSVRTIEGPAGDRPMWSVAVHPKDSTVAMCQASTVRLWDLSTGATLRDFVAGEGEVKLLAYHPDGTSLAVASIDGGVRTWDVDTGLALADLSRDAPCPRAMAFSPRGKLLAAVGPGRIASVWSTEKAELVAEWYVGTDAYSVAWVPGIDRVVIGEFDGTMGAWGALDGQQLWSTDLHGGIVEAVAVRPGSQEIYAGTEIGVLGAWWTQDGKRILSRSGETHHVTSMAISPDGSRLVAGGLRGKITSYGLGTRAPAATLSGHENAIPGVAFSPDGRHFVSVGYLGKARVWESETGNALHNLSPHPAAVWGLGVHPSGELIVSHCGDSVLRWFEARSGSWLFSQTETAKPISCEFDSTGERLVTGNADGTITLRDGEDGHELERAQVAESMISLTLFTPDDDALLVACMNGLVRLLDSESFEPIWVESALEAEGAPVRVQRSFNGAFSSDGEWFALSGVGNDVTLRRSDTGAVIRRLVGHEAPVTGLAVSPSDGRIASASLDRSVRIWSEDEAVADVVLRKGEDAPLSLVFRASGEQLLVGYESGDVRLWSTRSGLMLFHLGGDAHPATWVGFSRDEETVWAAHACGAVAAWNTSMHIARRFWRSEVLRGRLSGLLDEVVSLERVPERVDRELRRRLSDDPEKLLVAQGVASTWRRPDPNAINGLAWKIVDPDGPPGDDVERGLDYARYVVERAPDEPAYLDTLAWACYANGLHEEALSASELALEHVRKHEEEEQLPLYEEALARLKGLVASGR